ncbi:hypothetical protein D3C85_734460 [compost metagenome]
MQVSRRQAQDVDALAFDQFPQLRAVRQQRAGAQDESAGVEQGVEQFHKEDVESGIRDLQQTLARQQRETPFAAAQIC